MTSPPGLHEGSVFNRLLFASSNRHKWIEFRELLTGMPIDLRLYTEETHAPIAVVEDGKTFLENAKKKGIAIANATGFATLADDSGLEVDALGGAPGVLSARWGGAHATDVENNALLVKILSELAPPPSRFSARFCCALVFIPKPSGPCISSYGECKGEIVLPPRGEAGFGYDPLFIPSGCDVSFAELSLSEKNRRSHRFAALQQLLPSLSAWAQVQPAIDR